MEERREDVRLTKEDMAGYLSMANDYKDVNVLLSLEVGDFKDMPFDYLEYLLISIVPEERNFLRGRHEKVKGYKVSEVYDAVGIGNLHNRLNELAMEVSRKLGKETAVYLQESNLGIARRVPIQILGDIKYIAGRFYQDREERKQLVNKAIEVFKEECDEQLASTYPKGAKTILEHVEAVVRGTMWDSDREEPRKTKRK